MQEQKKYNLADGNIRKRFVTYKQAAELYSMGMNRIQEHAKAAGATYKMGNKVLINYAYPQGDIAMASSVTQHQVLILHTAIMRGSGTISAAPTMQHFQVLHHAEPVRHQLMN